MTREEQRALLVAFAEWNRDHYHGHLTAVRRVFEARANAFLASLPQSCPARCTADGCNDVIWTCELPAGHDGPHVENWGGGRRKEWR